MGARSALLTIWGPNRLVTVTLLLTRQRDPNTAREMLVWFVHSVVSFSQDRHRFSSLQAVIRVPEHSKWGRRERRRISHKAVD
jgi:hypothetical protein